MLIKRRITGIMACDPEGGIGYQGRLPWHLPEDLKHFRDTIAQQIIIMGKATYLVTKEVSNPGQYSVVFTQHPEDVHLHYGVAVSSIDEFKKLTCLPADKALYMIGGHQIAELFILNNLLDNFILTEISKTYHCDTFFRKDLLATWPKVTIKETAEFSMNNYINPKRHHDV